jgi:hypothetical protein
MSLKAYPADAKAVRAYAKKKGIREEEAVHKISDGAFRRWEALRKYQSKKKPAPTAKKRKKRGKKLKKAA